MDNDEESLCRKVESTLPRALMEVLDEFRGLVYIAGGFLRDLQCGQRPNDIDLWITSKVNATMLTTALRRAATRDIGYEPTVSESCFANTLYGWPNPVQVIFSWRYDSVAELLNDLDFRCCRAVYHWSEEAGQWVVTADHSFAQDCRERLLVYVAPEGRVESKANSLLRVVEFAQRGWYIDAENLGKVTLRATAGLPADPAEAQQALSRRFAIPGY